MVQLPLSARRAGWAGRSIIIETHAADAPLLRWTEAELHALELPLAAGPERDRRWIHDREGAALWLYEPGQPLWRIDEDGFVGLELELDWPHAAIGDEGVLIWSVALADRMEVFSTDPGAGFSLGLDHAQLAAPSGHKVMGD